MHAGALSPIKVTFSSYIDALHAQPLILKAIPRSAKAGASHVRIVPSHHISALFKASI